MNSAKQQLAAALVLMAIASAFYAGSIGFEYKSILQIITVPIGQYSLSLQRATCSSITQFGIITWTFDRAYECGQFANGDYWVVGPVTILSITPDFDGSHHGWQSNPMPGYPQGFDSRARTFDPKLVPSLPYNAKPGESIVKSISIEPLENADCRPCLETAAVLTVMASTPPDNGTTIFRPPYVGTQKPFYFVNQLRPELLPVLEPVPNTPSLETIKNNFQRVQLDHKLSWSGEYIHPKQNMASYGAGIAIRNAEGALRLMLNDSIQEKMPALINYVQAGIDFYAILKNGGSWGSALTGGGGHPHGRKLPIAFAAVLLNNQEMKDAIHNAGDNIFGENDGIKYSEKAGTVLYAEIGCSELVYWKKHADQLRIGPKASGSKTCKDPYGYVDGGGVPGASYISCCVSQNWKASSIAVRLMPELREVWNDEEFHDFSDRYADFGRWTQPDPCAPITGDCNVTKVPCTSANQKIICRSDEHCETKTFDTDYGVKYGQDKTKPGECIKDTDPSDGIGRVPQSHGTNKNTGGWGSRFANEMWNAYRIYETSCGNGLIDTGENCGNCPQDVKCQTGQICCNQTCTRTACASNSDCNAGQRCINAGQCDANCQNIECSQGAITNACYCQGQARTTGYCCNSIYQETPCQAPATCGNSVVDANENCSNCPADVQCSAGQKCCNNTCVKPACLNDTDCDDANAETTDKCDNAGSCTAACTHIATAECIDNAKLSSNISEWKQGRMTMLALMQKMKQWKAGTGCS